MGFARRIKKNILNNSIKNNLLSLYSVIVVIMSFLLLIMLFYSIDLNRTYNKIIYNFQNYNKINSQINSIDKDIYLNITEQKKFDGAHYDVIISDINNNLAQINDNFDSPKSVALVEIIKRTVNTLYKDIRKVAVLIDNNSSYADREAQLNNIIRVRDIIEGTSQELMEYNLSYSQARIDSIKGSYNVALFFIIVMFLIAIVSSIGFLLLVIKDTVNKINIVSDNANKLANGDLTIEPISFNESHEFQILALSFNKMKNNIKEYINELSSGKTRIGSIQNALNDCVISTNSSGEIKFCNNSIKKIFNFSQEEIIGRNINDLISVVDFSQYDSKRFDNEELIKNVKLIDGKYQVVGKKQDGTMIPVEVSYNEVETNEQRLITFIIHDITEHQQVEKMKDEFISVMSHEIRTPITSIRGALGLVLTGKIGVVSDKMNELLQIANNNCMRLSNLVNDILDMEKIKAGKMDFDIKQYDLVSIVKEAVDSSSDYAKQYNVKYNLATSIEKANVNVDRYRLIQALLNLLSNAAKFSIPDSVVEIEIYKLENNKIRVSVTDHGIGMTEEFQKKVFNRFLQADSSDTRKKGGTGLGLSITKELINIMGGQIGFESIINQGTTFYIDLSL